MPPQAPTWLLKPGPDNPALTMVEVFEVLDGLGNFSVSIFSKSSLWFGVGMHGYRGAMFTMFSLG